MDVPTTKFTLFVVSKDEWDIKEGTGKSMKNAFYVQQYGKSHLSGWKKINPVDLAIVELRMLVWNASDSQSGS